MAVPAGPNGILSVPRTSEVVAGGPAALAANVPAVLPRWVDDAARRFGVALYESMMTDPAVQRGVDTLLRAALADDLVVIPAVQVDEDAPEPPTAAERAEADLAAEVSDHCRRTLDGLDVRANSPDAPPSPFPLGAKALLYELGWWGLGTGNGLAEKVVAVEAAGPDAGKLVVKSVKTKPRNSYNYGVDRHMNLVGILAAVAAQDMPAGGPPATTTALLPIEKFVVAAWGVRHRDPRGNPIVRAAYPFWNLKQQDLPRYYKDVGQFGSGKVVITAAEQLSVSYPTDPATGRPDYSQAPIDTTADLLQKGKDFINGTVLVLPNGAAAQVIYPKGDSAAHRGFLDYLDAQVVASILGATRATEQAKFGSRADSETAQDYVGNIVLGVKEWLCGLVRLQVLRAQVAWNFGEDVAARLTPLVHLGQVEHQDFPANAAAIGTLSSSKALAPNQIQVLARKRLGCQLPDPAWPEPPPALAPFAGGGDNGPPGGANDGRGPGVDGNGTGNPDAGPPAAG